jgi:hypothetical protein
MGLQSSTGQAGGRGLSNILLVNRIIISFAFCNASNFAYRKLTAITIALDYGNPF